MVESRDQIWTRHRTVMQLGFGEMMCHLHTSPYHGNGDGKLRDPCPALRVLLGPQSGVDGGVPSELSDR